MTIRFISESGKKKAVKRIIYLCDCNVNGRMCPALIAIEYDEKKLSLHGTIGLMKVGIIKVACGQCYDEIAVEHLLQIVIKRCLINWWIFGENGICTI